MGENHSCVLAPMLANRCPTSKASHGLLSRSRMPNYACAWFRRDLQSHRPMVSQFFALRCRPFRLPHLFCPHINPFTMQIKADLFIIFRHKKAL